MFKLADINRSWLIAGCLAGVLGIYFLTADVTSVSDQNRPSTQNSNEADDVSHSQTALARVIAKQFPQHSISETMTLYGRTAPDRTVTVSAELAARVISTSAARGQLVKKGSEILRLNEGYLPAELTSAKAQVRQAQLDYDSAESLQSKNLIAENQLPQLEVALATANSRLRQLQIEMENTRVLAPVTGVLNTRLVEEGDFIENGNPVAELVDLDPLIVTVDVPQSIVHQLKIGDQNTVRYLDGSRKNSQIRYVSHVADASTRTFSVELAVPNPDMSLYAGLSVEVDLELDETKAIQVSAALLGLDEEGNPGIKWVDASNVVQFTPINIVRTDSSGIWLSGIPENARVITQGQGFVRAGDKVEVHSASAELLAGE